MMGMRSPWAYDLPLISTHPLRSLGFIAHGKYLGEFLM